VVEDFPSDVAFEATADIARRLAFNNAALDIFEGRGVAAHADDGYTIQGVANKQRSVPAQVHRSIICYSGIARTNNTSERTHLDEAVDYWIMSHAVDIYVGRRIRQRRRSMGMTLELLGNCIGAQKQQIGRFETGKNRVSASCLWEIAGALKVPVSYFFEGLEDAMTAIDRTQTDTILDQDAFELVRAFNRIPEDKRRLLLELAQTLRDGAKSC
jgi:transcriptional regulator with XRE-family HTH domain